MRQIFQVLRFKNTTSQGLNYMHELDEFSRHYFPSRDFQQVNLVEARHLMVADNSHKPSIGFLSSLIMFVTPIFVVLLWTSIALMVSADMRKLSRNHTVNSRLAQLPCRTCQFFHDNHHLNCAVHPTTVLTEQALGCSDYYSE